MAPIIDEHREELADLCRRFYVERMELFGSAAGPKFDLATSDLDFLVTFKPAPPITAARRYFGLLAALQDLFGLGIDLVEVAAITNPYFLQSVEKSRRPLYAA